ncbi:HAD family hydrolase [Thermus thermamylovorans]|uniref:HAD family hydrolase n=1 Tax=Thermus thermamylovorans TaxID=2509362 RepID=A0A4Q9B077_9DEIN|nr:HAD family hydrolase [Thermus thermamylovorans]TBH17545.1 HAD family hydrolase [Thermus thermamylovorans]
MRLWLLDLDDTLLQDHRVSQAVLEGLGRAVGVEGLFGAVGHRAEALFREAPFHPWAEAIGHSALEALWARYSTPGLEALAAWAWPFRERVFREALQEVGGPAERARELAEAFFAERRRYPLFPEVPEFLEALRLRGADLALLTNGVPDLQREKLFGAGLGEAFSLTLVSGEVGLGKPDPRLFRMALCAFGAGPEEAVMVGDNPGRDVRGALLAGIRAVLVDRGHRPPDPRYPAHLEVRDLREALALLEG